MARGQSDGSLIIDTKVDTSGVSDGINEVSAKMKSLESSVEKARKRVTDLNKELKEAKNTKMPTQEYIEIANQIKKAETRLNSLIAKQDEMIALGKNSGDSWKRNQYHVEELRNEIKYAKAEMEQLVKEGKAFTIGDKGKVNKISEQLKTATADLDSKQTRLNEEIKKLGTNGVNSATKYKTAFKSANTAIQTGVNKINTSIKGIIATLAPFVGIYEIFNIGRQATKLASDLQEVQNVVDVAFGDMSYKMENLAKTSVKELGMSELSAKQLGSTFMAMARQMTGDMQTASDMAIEMTKRAGDMASFYNRDVKDVQYALNGIMTGETETLKRYGVVMTEVNLQEYARSQGIQTSIKNMTQSQKVQLRYNYVMQQTALAEGDFVRTQNSWANRTRILVERWKQFLTIMGNGLITVLTPVVKMLNTIVGALINLANMIGSVFASLGIQIQQVGAGATSTADGMSDAVGATNDLTDAQNNLGKATKKAGKEAEKSTASFDTLNTLSLDKGGSSGSSGGSSSGSGGSTMPSTIDTSVMDNAVKKITGSLTDINDAMFNLGRNISEKLTKALNDIDWNKVYEGARTFGSGLASFLNGLITPELFGAVGKTVASTLNTAIYSALSFGKTFDFKNLGDSLAEGVNKFFETFDFGALADTIDAWVQGLRDTLVRFIKKVKWSEVIKGAISFTKAIDFDTLKIAFEAFAFYKGAKLLKSVIRDILASEIKTGMGTKALSVGTTIALLVGVAIAGFKFGKKLYETNETVQEISDALVEWLGDVFSGEYSLKDYVLDVKDLVLDFQFNKKDVRAKIEDVLGAIGVDNMKVDAILDFIYKTSPQGVAKEWGLRVAEWQNKIAKFLLSFTKVETVQERIKRLQKSWIGKTVQFRVAFLAYQTVKWVTKQANKLRNAWKGKKVTFSIIFEYAVKSIASKLGSITGKVVGGIKNAVSKQTKAKKVSTSVRTSSSYSTKSIPKLASGSVIKGGQPFLAWLGDQRAGQTNVEAPLDTIKQAVSEVMQTQGASGPSNQTVILELDGTQFGKAVLKYSNKEKQRVGLVL